MAPRAGVLSVLRGQPSYSHYLLIDPRTYQSNMLSCIQYNLVNIYITSSHSKCCLSRTVHCRYRMIRETAPLKYTVLPQYRDKRHSTFTG